MIMNAFLGIPLDIPRVLTHEIVLVMLGWCQISKTISFEGILLLDPDETPSAVSYR